MVNGTRLPQIRSRKCRTRSRCRRCSCDRQRVPRRRARVGGLCGFPDTAERVPAKHQKTGRCADVREHCGHGKRRKRTAAGEFRQREKPQAAKQDKAAGSCAPRGGHICPRCGQFRGFTRAFQTQRKTAGGRCGMKKAHRFKENDGVARKKCTENGKNSRCRGG